MVPLYLDFDFGFGQRPGTGRYTAKFVPFILPCLNLSIFSSLIFNPFTNQRELVEPLSIPYSSCTSKATTTPRRALIHLQPIEASANHHKNRKREELNVITNTITFPYLFKPFQTWIKSVKLEAQIKLQMNRLQKK